MPRAWRYSDRVFTTFSRFVETSIRYIAFESLGYSFDAGVLSGKYTESNPPTGPRGSLFTSEYLRKAAPLLDLLKKIGEERGKTQTQIALNWLMCQPGVLPIPGYADLRCV